VSGKPSDKGQESASLPADHSPAAAEPTTTGTMLAASRRAAGLELADIARLTRVPLRHLRSLEADYHDDLPALPYAQGFVRAYAKSVALDPEMMVARFRAETSKQPHVPAPIAMTALDERRLPKPGLVFASLAALVATLGLLAAWGSGAFDSELPPSAPPPSAPPRSAAPALPEADTLPTLAPSPPGASLAADAPVALTARDEVWVRIYDPTTKFVAMSGIMAPGERFDVPRTPPGLRLWTGRAGALAVTIGGTEIPPLGDPAEVLRDVSLAPLDLRARAARAAAPAPPPAPNKVE
jgi:cytoskeletal protein RodZ